MVSFPASDFKAGKMNQSRPVTMTIPSGGLAVFTETLTARLCA